MDSNYRSLVGTAFPAEDRPKMRWRFGAAGMPSEVRKLLSRAARMAAALGGSPGERAKLVREFVEKIIVDEKTIIITCAEPD